MTAQPNIIVFLSDQHKASFLGHTTDEWVMTPTLDRLAQEGVRFGSCYCSYPLCVPSRMGLMTGLPNHKINVWGNSDSLGSNIPTVAHAMGLAGYRTVLAGRMHFVGGDEKHGFQERAIGDVSGPHLGTNRAEHRFRGYYGDLVNMLKNSGAGDSYDQQYDTAVAMEACRVIRDHEVSADPRPLFMVVGFYLPHDPYRIRPEYFANYENVREELPADWRGEKLHPLLRSRREVWQKAGLGKDEIQRARNAYRGRVEYLDSLIGQTVYTLSESPLGKNLLTAYTSDHGDHIGSHGRWGKGTFYDDAARVPLIIHWPDELPADENRTDPINQIDLMPTLISIAGGKALPGTVEDGFTAYLKGESDNPDRFALSEHVFRSAGEPVPARMVRRGNWKLNRYATDEEPYELFNLDEDPEELYDLSGEDSNQELIAELSALAESDGWDPEFVRDRVQKQQPGIDYITRWGWKVQPTSENQWGLPGQL